MEDLRSTEPNRPLVQLPIDEKDENALEYDPLPHGHIRAFMLLPGTQEEEITIMIISFDLNNDAKGVLKYMEALSYTWGDLSPMRKIYVRQGEHIKCLSVTPNLYDALVALRSTTEYRCFWVDQICINQRDNSEKSSQVQLMQYIYSKADQVVVWLSKEIFANQDLVAHLNKIIFLYQQMAKSIQKSPSYSEIKAEMGLNSMNSIGSATSATQDDESEEVLGLRAVSKESWEAVILVFGHPYFTRVWMIQEVVMAKQCVIMAGGGSIEWVHIERIGQFLQSGSEHLGKLPLPPKLRKNTRCLEKMITLRTRLKLDLTTLGITWSSREKWSLLDLVRKVWEFNATDLRDKVFSLIGLLSFESQCIPQDIVPDYSSNTTYQQVVWDITVTGFTKDRCLYSLIMCHPNRKPTIPSWMADVENPHDNAMRYPLGISWMSFNASSNSTAVARKVPNSRDALLFKTTHIGTISSLGSAAGLDDADLTNLGDESFSIALTADPVRVYKIITESWEQITGLESDKCFNESPEFETMLKCFSETFFCKFPMLKEHGKQWLGTAEMDIFRLLLQTRDQQLPEEEMQTVASCLLEPLARCHSMRMCGMERQNRLETGIVEPLLCWAPREALVGDVLAVIHGFRLPMLLRRIPGVKKRYRFLGIAYVNGFMHGEALTTKGLSAEYTIVA